MLFSFFAKVLNTSEFESKTPDFNGNSPFLFLLINSTFVEQKLLITINLSNMKLKLFFLFLLILIFTHKGTSQCFLENTTFGKLKVDLNVKKSNISLKNTECNLCKYNNITGVISCSCKNSCAEDNQIITPEEQIIVNQCNQSCQWATPYVGYCVYECYKNNGIIKDCTKVCGEIQPIVANLISYRYSVYIWYTDGLVATTGGTPNFSFESGLQLPPISNTINVTIPDLTGKAYCYQVSILTQYDSGKCCLYYDSKCVDNG
jgi:hypothetical protein